MKSTNIPYLPAVDHMRAFAALLIVLYHGVQLVQHELIFKDGIYSPGPWPKTGNPLFAMIVEGHTSVGFFMVLSGFIFCSGTLGRDLSYWRFLGNRILRIYPLYVFVLVASVYASPGGWTFVGLLASLLFQANLPGAFVNIPFLGVAWAIAVEFQFYLAFPFIIRFVRKYGSAYLLGLLAVVWMYRMFAVTLGAAATRDVSYWTIVGRMDEFIAGIAMGVLYVRRPQLVRQMRYLLPLGAAAIVGCIYWFHKRGGYDGAKPWVWFFWPTIEGAGWATFALCYLNAAEWLPRVVSRVLAYIGELSFSMYITHFSILTLLCGQHLVFGFPGIVDPATNALLYTVFIVVPLVIAVSSLSYYVIERPFLTMRRSYVSAPAQAAA